METVGFVFLFSAFNRMSGFMSCMPISGSVCSAVAIAISKAFLHSADASIPFSHPADTETSTTAAFCMLTDKHPILVHSLEVSDVLYGYFIPISRREVSVRNFRGNDHLQDSRLQLTRRDKEIESIPVINNLVLRDGQSIRVHDIHEVDEQTLIEEMVGRKIENLYPKVNVPIGDVVMKVEHLSVPHPTIKNRNIVEDISFSVRKGEILGIGGLVGAGRSEILGAIFGQITKGVTKTIEIEGQSVQISGPPDAIDHGIGFVTEERKLNGFVWMLSIRDNMYLPSLKEIPTKYGIMIDAKEENKRTTSMFDRLKIKAPSIHTIVNTLSGGNQQKVVLSKWLLKSPKILFVDEPTKGVDVGAKAEIYSLMGELVKSGISIVMVSSDMPELLAMSDRVLVISSGHITGEFDREHLSEEAVMRAAIK